LTHPSVVECGVVGAPDEARGMIVKAYVIAAPGVTPDAELVVALQEHVKREIAPYKYPRAIEFVTQLPKTETGKLKRFALRHLARLTWYVVDMDEYLTNLKELGKVYRAIFGAHYPAMALVQVVRLVEKAARVEIEATAVIPR